MPRTKKALSTNGATAPVTSVRETVAALSPSAPRRHPAVGSTREITGQYTPPTGPITNVSQLINGGRNAAKGSAGSFESMGEYTTHLRGLSLHDLHRHALEDVRIVPIDDRDRLIRRLETEWTATAARYPGRRVNQPIPQRVPFSAAQMEAQADIKRKILKQ